MATTMQTRKRRQLTRYLLSQPNKRQPDLPWVGGMGRSPESNMAIAEHSAAPEPNQDDSNTFGFSLGPQRA